MPSSGNTRGGAWCAVRSTPQWFDLDSLEPCEAPPPEMPLGDIRAWTQGGRRLALVRARVMSGQDRWTMPPGTWFETGNPEEQPPAALDRSGVNLGTVRGTDVPCKPSTPILGQIGEAWRREALLNGQDGLTVLRSSRPKPVAERPESLLHMWMRHRHPRLRGTELDRRTRGCLGDLEAIVVDAQVRLRTPPWRPLDQAGGSNTRPLSMNLPEPTKREHGPFGNGSLSMPPQPCRANGP